MFDPAVFSQREQFSVQVAAVGKAYLKDHAQALYLINNELSRSLQLEYRLIQQVSHLNVEDRAEVHRFTVMLDDYVDRAVYDNERTRCSLIARAWFLETKRTTGTDGERNAAAKLERLIDLFRTSDHDFIDQVESAAQTALDVTKRIAAHVRSGDINAARALQETFKDENRAELRRLKKHLRQLNDNAMLLIDKL